MQIRYLAADNELPDNILGDIIRVSWVNGQKEYEVLHGHYEVDIPYNGSLKSRYVVSLRRSLV